MSFRNRFVFAVEKNMTRPAVKTGNLDTNKKIKFLQCFWKKIRTFVPELQILLSIREWHDEKTSDNTNPIGGISIGYDRANKEPPSVTTGICGFAVWHVRPLRTPYVPKRRLD